MSAAQLAEACYIEHGWEVAGNWVSMVTRRSDELRMDELKKNFEYRVANAPIVVAKEGGKEYTAKESVTVKGTWSEDRIYCPYPTTDGEKNPNLKGKLLSNQFIRNQLFYVISTHHVRE